MKNLLLLALGQVFLLVAVVSEFIFRDAGDHLFATFCDLARHIFQTVLGCIERGSIIDGLALVQIRDGCSVFGPE